MARKVFASDALIKAIHYVFSGAPNAYIWNEHAVRSAVLRRRIAAGLVQAWFGPKLSVAEAYGHAWDEQTGAFEISCRFSPGRHVQLHHPFTSSSDGQLGDLVRQVMRPLQAHLAEAGLDGLVWQAGRGNPVALNNFLREGADQDGGGRWVWIDLESGVPALIPINPLDLILFYLPKSLRHRCALFDDVDIPRLRTYVAAHRDELAAALGSPRLDELTADIDSLAESQRQWKSLPRHERSITYRLTKGVITQAQADWYKRHPLLWYGRELSRSYRPVLRAVWGLGKALVARLRAVDVLEALKSGWLLVGSQRYRARIARDYVGRRIAHWQDRGQLEAADADELRRGLDAEEASTYLTDFGVHVGIKPLVKTLQWWVLPALFATGHIDGLVFGVLMVEGGAVARTIYTLGRLLQNTVRRREKPWVALAVGMMPMIGNLAYPLQLLFRGAHTHAPIAQFIVYDTFSRLGRWTPIWGGPDTLTEHLFNRLPDRLIRRSVHRSSERSQGAEG